MCNFALQGLPRDQRTRNIAEQLSSAKQAGPDDPEVDNAETRPRKLSDSVFPWQSRTGV